MTFSRPNGYASRRMDSRTSMRLMIMDTADKRKILVYIAYAEVRHDGQFVKDMNAVILEVKEIERIVR
jgi:hypothetical protein